MARFMTGGVYANWTSQEADPNRIAAVRDRDLHLPEENAAVLAELLSKRRRELRTFIGQIAKVASKNMYAAII